jgi:hypothetical protein
LRSFAAIAFNSAIGKQSLCEDKTGGGAPVLPVNNHSLKSYRYVFIGNSRLFKHYIIKPFSYTKGETTWLVEETGYKNLNK